LDNGQLLCAICHAGKTSTEASHREGMREEASLLYEAGLGVCHVQETRGLTCVRSDETDCTDWQ
jgi:hypothetical protein